MKYCFVRLFWALVWVGLVMGCNRNVPPPKFTNCGSPVRNLTIFSSHVVRSPLTPAGRYPPNAECKWNFNVADDCIPVLVCSQFEVVNSFDCSEDFLRVSESNPKVSPLRLCGFMDTTVPLNVDSSGLKTTSYSLTFVSNLVDEGSGFKCVVACRIKPTPQPTTTVTSAPAPTTALPKGKGTSAPPKPQPPLQVQRECDCVDSSLIRIVGGVEARKNQFVWQVALKYDGNFLCGGSVIGPFYILTASHCTRNREASRFQVLLGRHDISKPTEPGGQQRSVSAILVHPKADPLTLNFDFAILKLSTPVDVTTNAIGAVCLPRDDSDKFESKPVVASGWGTRNPDKIDLPSILNMVELKTTDGSCGQYSPDEITENMLCSFAPGKDACQGDSGGPLVLQRDTGYTLIGVTSWGTGCASSGFPGVYARVSKVLDWISTATGGKICS